MEELKEIHKDWYVCCIRDPLFKFYTLEMNEGNITIDEWFSKIKSLYSQEEHDTKPSDGDQY